MICETCWHSPHLSDCPENPTNVDEPDVAEELARRLLGYDSAYPGDAEASIEIPADEWAEWLELARQI